jgi:hypothetical protein
LADVLALLFWPEFMATPEWVDERGTPMPWAVPSRRRGCAHCGTSA